MKKPYLPANKMLSQFSMLDGTIEFYGRVRSVLSRESIVVDFGAGRAAWYADGDWTYTKTVRNLKPDVARLIACDINTAVLENLASHQNLVMCEGIIPLSDDSVDVLIADYVLEHVGNPAAFFCEVDRVLKPGGYFCARTPHTLNYVALAARLVKNSRHAAVIKRLQPGRKEIDVFPTAYKLNTMRAVRALWRKQEWEDFSYLYTSEPQYYFGSKVMYGFMSLIHTFLPSAVTGNLFIFLRKKK